MCVSVHNTLHNKYACCMMLDLDETFTEAFKG